MNTHPIAALLTLALAAPALVLTLGCSSSSAVAGAADLAKGIDGEWILSKLGTQDVASMLPKGATLPNLAFGADGSVSGFGGVNRLFGSVNPADLAAGKIDLSKLGSTMMAGDPAASGVESKFLAALGRAKSFGFDSAGRLNLSDGAAPLASFVRPAK